MRFSSMDETMKGRAQSQGERWGDWGACEKKRGKESEMEDQREPRPPQIKEYHERENTQKRGKATENKQTQETKKGHKRRDKGEAQMTR